MSTDWPAHTQEWRPWRQHYRGGTRADRTVTQVQVNLPPLIANAEIALDAHVITRTEQALRSVATLDAEHGPELDALATLLLRTESVASSKIEQIEASVDDYARALHGGRANASATSMAAATTALSALIGSVDGGQDLSLDSILVAHRALMRDDEQEASYAGRVRDMQNWIGGSDHSPRNAWFVPPPPELVDGYLRDLIDFANRDVIPVLAQASIAHAQFESIHPFTDGNGRIGRALINTALRRRGATTRVVVPLASALVARRERYFDLLGEYRSGHAAPIITAFADATELAAQESRATARRLAQLPAEWREQTGPFRANSAVSKLLELLERNPIFTADEVATELHTSTSSTYAAVERLHSAGVIRPLTSRRRDQVWGAAAILDELDDLGGRIAYRTGSDTT